MFLSTDMVQEFLKLSLSVAFDIILNTLWRWYSKISLGTFR